MTLPHLCYKFGRFFLSFGCLQPAQAAFKKKGQLKKIEAKIAEAEAKV